MLKVGRLLKRTTRRTFVNTLGVLLILSAWQYYDQGRISWHYSLLDWIQSYAEDLSGTPHADNASCNNRAIPAGPLLSGRVVDVKDGDTFVLRTADRTRYTIRLHGIDAPEWNQPHGRTASSALSRLISGREVTLAIADIDNYGRLVAQVRYQEQDVNLILVCNGHAWWYKQYAKSDQSLADAEAAARLDRLGLWSDENTVPPWIWRRRH